MPRILQTGDFTAGTAFATLNLATQSGLKSLSPYKELAEQALAGIFRQMIDRISLDSRPVLAYHQQRNQVGKQIVLDPAKFDPARLYIEAARVQMFPQTGQPASRRRRPLSGNWATPVPAPWNLSARPIRP